MKRQIPGLHAAESADSFLEGLFLVRVDRAYCNWHRQSPFFLIRFAVLEPKEYQSRSIAGRIYCTPKALWRLNWFLRDFGYDTDLLGRDEVDEKALLGLTGVIRTSRRSLVGRSFLNIDGFASAAQWEELSVEYPARSGKDDCSDGVQLHTN
jgi:hypothetical protein